MQAGIAHLGAAVGETNFDGFGGQNGGVGSVLVLHILHEDDKDHEYHGGAEAPVLELLVVNFFHVFLLSFLLFLRAVLYFI